MQWTETNKTDIFSVVSTEDVTMVNLVVKVGSVVASWFQALWFLSSDYCLTGVLCILPVFLCGFSQGSLVSSHFLKTCR